ncbi:hypothetical protein PybrP1_011621 [[Pythium] brassicae (nom. inval.)]|nr:hypothetical protein PybrP1_011621 [[Pythium] brassicae (nom. inval.)]
MRLSFIPLAAVAAVALTSVDAQDCPLTQLTPLLSNPNVTACSSATGFSFTAPAIPTGPALTALCSSAECQGVLAFVKGLGLGDCTLLGVKLESGLLNPLTAACGSSNSSSASNGTSSTTSPPTVGSTPSTTNSPNNANTAPSGSTTSPSPTPSSAAAATTGIAATVAFLAFATMIF